MKENEKLLLKIKSSRISSLKSLFFPMEYQFMEIDGNFLVFMITKNWIGQKTTSQEYGTFFDAKGIFLRKLVLLDGTGYGRFWWFDVKKAKKVLNNNVPKSMQLKWSNRWF